MGAMPVIGLFASFHLPTTRDNDMDTSDAIRLRTNYCKKIHRIVFYNIINIYHELSPKNLEVFKP